MIRYFFQKLEYNFYGYNPTNHSQFFFIKSKINWQILAFIALQNHKISKIYTYRDK